MAQTFSRSTPNILVNSSSFVDSGFPSTNMRNLGHAPRNSEGGVSGMATGPALPIVSMSMSTRVLNSSKLKVDLKAIY